VLLDVSLDLAGVPDGVDPAWQAKHYLGAPYPGGDEASVNLAHVVAAVEFVAVEMADLPSEKDTPTPDEVVADLGRIAEEPLAILPASSA
jgi:hypothetical protein